MTCDIDPYPEHAEPLRRRDIPFEMVANHPGVGGSYTQIGERATIDALVGLPKSQLSFDKNRVEEIGKTEPLDFLPLRRTGTVGYQRKPATRRAQPSQRLDRVRKSLHSFIAAPAVGIADSRRDGGVLDTGFEQREPDDLASRNVECEPAGAMALGIAPELLRRYPDGLNRRVRAEGTKQAGVLGARLAPAAVNAARIVKNRIVEIEENAPGKHYLIVNRTSAVCPSTVIRRMYLPLFNGDLSSREMVLPSWVWLKPPLISVNA